MNFIYINVHVYATGLLTRFDSEIFKALLGVEVCGCYCESSLEITDKI